LTDEFKAETVKPVKQSDRTMSAIAMELGISGFGYECRYGQHCAGCFVAKTLLDDVILSAPDYSVSVQVTAIADGFVIATTPSPNSSGLSSIFPPPCILKPIGRILPGLALACRLSGAGG
jgi:hypothetical protein